MIPERLAHLHLRPHPEGGYFRETYRSAHLTTIDYLLLAGQFSGWHRVRSADEVWNHAQGGPLRLHLLDSQGYRAIELGGCAHSSVVPAGTWQAAEAMDGWALVGCTVGPPFQFSDFEMADASLVDTFPEHEAMIRRLLRL